MQDKTATGAELDKLIEEFSKEFPEKTELECGQERIDAESRERLNMGGDPGFPLGERGVPDPDEWFREWHEIADKAEADRADAKQFEQYYGEPPTPAVDREPGE